MKKLILVPILSMCLFACNDPKVQEDMKKLRDDHEQLRKDHEKLREDHNLLIKDALKSELNKEDALEGSAND